MEPVANRRSVLAGLGGTALVTLLPAVAAATPEERDAAVRAFAGAAAIRKGRVHLDLPPLVENGNSAPLTVSVESPMSEGDHVRRLAIFNERNPQPNVLDVRFGPGSGRAQVTTRIRLANSQRILAVAEMSDGTFWQDGAEVIVTLAACVEG